MENQHRKISGYSELSQTEIDLMNEIKAFGPQLESLACKIYKHLEQQRDQACSLENTEEMERLEAATPMLWSLEGEMALKKGLMFLTRSVAQPTFF